MVTGLREGLRLTAIVDNMPTAHIGETLQFCLPPVPDSWFSPDGRRIN
jgi:iron(III) transport system ATP-binding protein